MTTMVLRQSKKGNVYRYYGQYQRKYPNGKILSDSPSSRKNIKACLIRDNYTCQICGATTNVNAHHKDGRSYVKSGIDANNDLSNLISLCDKCHQRLHYNVFEKYREIISRRLVGETYQSIADFYGVSRQCIQQLVKRAAMREFPETALPIMNYMSSDKAGVTK